jgi:choline dehydrogenase-like flavoprotein
LVTGYLNDESGFDTQLMVWMYKKQREMIRRMPTYRGEYCPDHPSFPEGSDAACVTVDEPFPEDAPDIKYTAEDDKAIEEWCRKVVASHSHSVGTCKMGSRHKGGVLDKHLNVYGVQGLKVVDLSIAPSTVQSNSANLAFTIGEKAADIASREFQKETS